jgi:hypothetical protein
MELDADNEKINIDVKLKRKINVLFQKIYETTRIPPIFLDPVIWKISSNNCRDGKCLNCFFKDNLRYDCIQSKKMGIGSITKGRKQYYLSWNANRNIK